VDKARMIHFLQVLSREPHEQFDLKSEVEARCWKSATALGRSFWKMAATDQAERQGVPTLVQIVARSIMVGDCPG